MIHTIIASQDSMIKKLDDYKLNHVDFIKIDVEGFENQVVLGAKNRLIKNKPLVIIEEKEFSDRYNEKESAAIDTLNLKAQR